MFTARSAFLVLLLCLFGCGGSADATQTWEAEVSSWKEARVESLRKNWVSLAGLHWLDDRSTFGSDGSNDFVFPSSLPPTVGRFVLGDNGIVMEVEPGLNVRVDGAPADTAVLKTDDEGEPSRAVLGDVEWYAIERDGRYAIRVHDHARAASLTVDDLPFYELDAGWRIRGRFEPYEPVRTVPVPTVMGTLTDLASPGRIAFEIGDQTYRLDVLEGSATRYFVMFADETNRTETYEAGRYVYIDHEDENGDVVIDFNQSYNPPCAFTPYATCPFPPPQNRLATAVEAGEKRIEHEG